MSEGRPLHVHGKGASAPGHECNPSCQMHKHMLRETHMCIRECTAVCACSCRPHFSKVDILSVFAQKVLHLVF